MSSESMPKFNPSISRRWTKKFAKSWQRASRLQNRLSRVPEADMTGAERNAFFDRQDKALDELDELGEEQAQMVAEIVLDVPRDWLADDAPDNLDWSDVESYDYILQSKYGELVQMLITGEAFQVQAKN